jgi:formamidopyrimidine-DNA glycosylase
MIELPEAVVLASQINDTIKGKRIAMVTAAHTPHKLAWYYGDRQKYSDILVGRTIGKTAAYGGLVEIKAGNANILLGEGAGIRFHRKGEPRPAKHQYLVEFDDGTALSAAVQMYGGMGAFLEGELDNLYYKVAKEKPSPFSPAFDKAYFDGIASAPEVQKLSLKALLATEQRIPGLGNGILQDILFNARLHPKKKVNALTGREKEILFNSVRNTISAMTAQGGRDTELDLFGNPGGYKTILSKNTVNKPCPVCGTTIKKEAYMGGSVYYCQKCQKL